MSEDPSSGLYFGPKPIKVEGPGTMSVGVDCKSTHVVASRLTDAMLYMVWWLRENPRIKIGDVVVGSNDKMWVVSVYYRGLAGVEPKPDGKEIPHADS